MTARDCGGCRGEGSHRRWCEVAVGPHAAYLGRLAERAESLGDSIGPNEMGAANHVWMAAALLRAAAQQRATEYSERITGSTGHEGSPAALLKCDGCQTEAGRHPTYEAWEDAARRLGWTVGEDVVLCAACSGSQGQQP